MNALELVASVSIAEVWSWLGGHELRGKRGRAFWRETRDFNIALNSEKGTWYDHARAEGGGILSLIERVRGCSRGDAIRWLSHAAGVSLDGQVPTRAAREHARQRAREASWWRTGRIASMEAQHRRILADRDAGTLLDIENYAAIAQELWRLRSASTPALISFFDAAEAADPGETRRMVDYGRTDEAHTLAVAAAIVGMLAAAEMRECEAVA